MIRLPAFDQSGPRDQVADAGPGLPGAAGEEAAGALPLWRVHIPTVEESCVRVRCRQAAGTGPWPLSTALTELGRLGVRATERFRSLGSGRGQPLIHSQEAAWRGLAVHLESLVSSGGAVVEAALALPAMDEVVRSVDEDSWWDLVDAFAAAVDAVHGALVDGEPLDLGPPDSAREWRRRAGDHLALLVPEGVELDWEPAASAYTALPLSRLTVVLR
jgi:hypothetical protein